MTTPASLLLIPDISGFTAFVHDTELEHSQHIVSGLLETLINANQLDLTVAEIEGDAVLFYAEERVPEPLRVQAQAQAMFQAFHRWIAEFVATCPCSCRACQSVGQLTLKVVAHAGPLRFIQVHQFRKPFGAAVIVLHRLLKNDLASHEYLLLTDDLLALTPHAPLLLPFGGGHSSAIYAEVGKVGFVHLPLRPQQPAWTRPANLRRTQRQLLRRLAERVMLN